MKRSHSTALMWGAGIAAAVGGLVLLDRALKPLQQRLKTGDSVKVLSSKVSLDIRAMANSTPAEFAAAQESLKAMLARLPTGIVDIANIILAAPETVGSVTVQPSIARGVISPGFPVEFNTFDVISATRAGKPV